MLPRITRGYTCSNVYYNPVTLTEVLVPHPGLVVSSVALSGAVSSSSHSRCKSKGVSFLTVVPDCMS
jgi:hypothetical protein